LDIEENENSLCPTLFSKSTNKGTHFFMYCVLRAAVLRYTTVAFVPRTVP